MEATSRTAGSLCPYLGTLTQQFKEAPPIEYPSFENRCLATENGDTLMLTDQATFCLCSGYRYCPRYQAVAAFDKDERGHLAGASVAAYESRTPTTLDSDQFSASLGDLQDGLVSASAQSSSRKHFWGWLGAGMIFVSVFLCGSVAAIYTGWQLVNANLTASQGNVATLATATATPPPVYVIMTATSPPESGLGDAAPTPTTGLEFPVAVTATPLQGNAAPAVVVNGAPGAIVALAPNPAPPTPTAVYVAPAVVPIQALPELNAALPTRRDTPDPALLQIPESTPLTETPTPLPTPTTTATMAPPSVVFGPESTELKAGKCTLVHWNVENVREVYYENLPVNGHGEKEECVDDEDEIYTLTVILPDGAPRIYTTTVSLLDPTPTPTPTSTFTPIPEFTPTWTPVPPTSTPAPNYQYGVGLAAANGESHSCAIGASCAIGLLLTNTGNTVDSLSVSMVKHGPWTGQLCRQDGVCSSDRLTLVNVGEANTAYITLKIDIPSDASPSDESFTYVIRAASEQSGGSATSGDLSIQVKAQ